jgi:ribosomal protein L29
MSRQETNKIRELTPAELERVTGAASQEQFRGRYQLKLSEAGSLLKAQ